jgi:hypothetical protein
MYYTIQRGAESAVIAWEDNDDPAGPKFRVTFPQHEIAARKVVERLNGDPSDMRALSLLVAFMKTPFAYAMKPGVGVLE